ncbi:hypothetical protein SALBM135S_00018 [Streptomyces alboniger]
MTTPCPWRAAAAHSRSRADTGVSAHGSARRWARSSVGASGSRAYGVRGVVGLRRSSGPSQRVVTSPYARGGPWKRTYGDPSCRVRRARATAWAYQHPRRAAQGHHHRPGPGRRPAPHGAWASSPTSPPTGSSPATRATRNARRPNSSTTWGSPERSRTCRRTSRCHPNQQPPLRPAAAAVLRKKASRRRLSPPERSTNRRPHRSSPAVSGKVAETGVLKPWWPAHLSPCRGFALHDRRRLCTLGTHLVLKQGNNSGINPGGDRDPHGVARTAVMSRERTARTRAPRRLAPLRVSRG